MLTINKRYITKTENDKGVIQMDMKDIIGLRMERQFLTRKANEEEYIELYRDTQPGQNVYWHGFGEPPVISFRADFDDLEFNRDRQEERELVKGRFQGGNLGWVDWRDLELFACMCKKPLDRPTEKQMELLELINRDGPMNIQQMKEITGMLVKEITPALHRLQEAFLIYEDQYDGEWDRGWYRFSEMFPDVDIEKYTRLEALKTVLQRFAYRMVWFDIDMVKSFYRLPVKDIKAAVSALAEEGTLTAFQDGFLLKSDYEILESSSYAVPHIILIMHRNDILIKAFEHVLKKKYILEDCDVLQYIIIDGEVHGAVMGKFKYGPYIIEDVITDEGYERYRDNILPLIQDENPGSDIKRFMGKKL